MNKTHMAKMNLLQLFGSPLFYLSVLGVSLAFFITVQSEINSYSSLLYLLDLFIGLFMPKKLVVLLAAIPYAASFCSDWNHEYLKFIIVRSGVRKYTTSKVLVGFLSAFLTSFLGIVIALFCLSFFYPIFSPIESVKDVVAAPFASLAYSPVPFTYLLAEAAVFSMAAATWATVGMAFSAYIPNYFATLTSALVFSYVLETFTTTMPAFLNLNAVTKSYDILHQGALISFLYFAFVFFLYSGVAGFLFHYRVRGRVRNEVA